MLIHEMREALKGIPGYESLTIDYHDDGTQTLTLGDKVLQVGPMASNDEIRAALRNPTVPTQNTKVTMASPLQGFGQKLSKLKHDTEFDATKLAARVDALAARKDAAMAKSTKYLDGHEQDIVDIEKFVTEVEQATNGGPA